MYQDGDPAEWIGAHEVLEGRGVIERSALSWWAHLRGSLRTPILQSKH